MLYLFRGSDGGRVRERAFAWIAAARTKEPNLTYVRLASEDLCDATLEEVTSSTGLFVQRLLVLLDDPFPTSRVREEWAEDMGSIAAGGASPLDPYLEALAVSDNAVVVLAPGLSSLRAKKLVPFAKVDYVFDAPTSRAVTRGFNTDLVNALAARNREKLWLEVVLALRAGDAPEMLHGLLHWKARDVMERGARAWSPAAARELSLSLITLLQESRRAGLDLAQSLERFALAIQQTS